MKIAIDARFYGHENGGLGRYTINLLRELGKIDTKNEYVVVIRKAYSGKLDLPENFSEVIVDAHHYSFSEQILLPLALFKINADVTHFLHFNVPLLYRRKFVVTVHDMIMHHMQSREATTLSGPLYLVKRAMYFLTFRNAVRTADKIIAPTTTVKKEIAAYYKVDLKKIFVTKEGIDSRISRVKSTDFIKKYEIHSPYFLYVGNAYPHKNVPMAIEALVSLNRELKQKVSFVIVTPRDFFYEKLKSSIDKKDSEKWVRVFGKVSDNELSELYSHALAFIYPSLIEGFGLPALEAMSVGTPALVSDINVFHEVYEDHARYFDPTNIDSMKEQMRAITLLKPSQREQLAKSVSKYTKKYSWSFMARDTLAVYEA